MGEWCSGSAGRRRLTRVSVFLNIFDVHVNRAPHLRGDQGYEIPGGPFHVASREECSTGNEQNVVTVRAGTAPRVVFKQIAGLIARRIVFNRKPGDRVEAGERVGLIKFGSRVDVLFGPDGESWWGRASVSPPAPA